MQTDNRPLSPHLQIYKQGWTGIPSVLHRGTGIALSAGSLFLVYWLVALAGGPESYQSAQAVFGSLLGRIVLFGFTFALFYHLCAGIRHLFWDAVIGLDIDKAVTSAKLVVGASIALTVLTWLLAFTVGGV